MPRRNPPRRQILQRLSTKALQPIHHFYNLAPPHPPHPLGTRHRVPQTSPKPRCHHTLNTAPQSPPPSPTTPQPKDPPHPQTHLHPKRTQTSLQPSSHVRNTISDPPVPSPMTSSCPLHTSPARSRSRETTKPTQPPPGAISTTGSPPARDVATTHRRTLLLLRTRQPRGQTQRRRGRVFLRCRCQQQGIAVLLLRQLLLRLGSLLLRPLLRAAWTRLRGRRGGAAAGLQGGGDGEGVLFVWAWSAVGVL